MKKEATPDLQGGSATAPPTGCIETQVMNQYSSQKGYFYTLPALYQTEPSRREVLEATIARLLRPHYGAEADARKVILNKSNNYSG